MFRTRPSERTAGLCGSGRAAGVWGSMTGLDMTGAIWRLWLGGLGASCCWWWAMFPSNIFTKLIIIFQKKKKSTGLTWFPQNEAHQLTACVGNTTGMGSISHYLQHNESFSTNRAQLEISRQNTQNLFLFVCFLTYHSKASISKIWTFNRLLKIKSDSFLQTAIQQATINNNLQSFKQTFYFLSTQTPKHSKCTINP